MFEAAEAAIKYYEKQHRERPAIQVAVSLKSKVVIEYTKAVPKPSPDVFLFKVSAGSAGPIVELA